MFLLHIWVLNLLIKPVKPVKPVKPLPLGVKPNGFPQSIDRSRTPQKSRSPPVSRRSEEEGRGTSWSLKPVLDCLDILVYYGIWSAYRYITDNSWNFNLPWYQLEVKCKCWEQLRIAILAMLRRARWKPKDDRSCRHPGGLSRVVELEGDLRKRSEKRNGKQEQSRIRLRPGFG